MNQASTSLSQSHFGFTLVRSRLTYVSSRSDVTVHFRSNRFVLFLDGASNGTELLGLVGVITHVSS